ncbi:MAG: HAD family phosphatase [Actinobacteria bacterium]|nr:HAD family phosphatase [Actinomycetota bacterium]
MQVFANEEGIELQDLARVALRAYIEGDDDLVTPFETGAMPEEEFSIQFAQRLALETGKEIDPERFVARMFGGVRLEEGMLDAVLTTRRAGYKTALLSNSWGLTGYPRERFEELFDVVVISAEVGMRKPHPEIFRFTVDKLGVEASRCVFVDDHPGHLKAALAEGMTTVLHRSPAQTIVELEQLLGLALP